MNRILLLFTAVFCPLFNKLKQIVLSFLQGNNQNTLSDNAGSLKTIVFSMVLLLVYTNNYGQCSVYPSGTSQIGSVNTFCIDNTNTITVANVRNGQYVLLNVVKGFTYSFSIGNVFTSGLTAENLTIFDASNNAFFIGGANSNGYTISNWTSTISGQIKVLLSRGTCVTTDSSGGTLTMTLNSIGNTQDSQTTAGTDTWVGHLYNAGGASPEPFVNANYAGYYTDGLTESFSGNFGGSTACIPILSNGTQKASIYAEGFAVRYRMKSTRPAGCYFVKVTGDDGVRLYIDNSVTTTPTTKVFDKWNEQSTTTYYYILVNLPANANIVLDYYENGGQNEVGFEIEPFDPAANTITAPATTEFCSGGNPGLIEGSFKYNSLGTEIANPYINYQWQISVDGGAYSNISGATSRTYDPPATNNATSVNIVKRYKRLATVNTTNAVGVTCTFNESNVVTITTSPGSPVVPGAITGVVAQCSSLSSQIYSISTVTNATTYTWTVPSGWSITSGQGTTSMTVTTGAVGNNGNISVTAGNGCGTSATKTLAVTVVGSIGGTISGSSSVCAGTNSTVFALSGITGSVVRWESSTNNFATAGVVIANTTTGYTATNIAATTYYRAVVQNGSCSIAYSTVGIVTIMSPVTTGVTICQGDAGIPLTATASCSPVAQTPHVATGTGGTSESTSYGGTGNTNISINFPALPVGAIVTSINTTITYTANTNGNVSWLSELRVEVTPPVAVGGLVSNIQPSTSNSGGTLTDVPFGTWGIGSPVGNWLFRFRETLNDGGPNPDANIANIKITVNYTLPGTLDWYDAASGGNLVESGNSFNPINDPEVIALIPALANTNTPGTYTFYAECSSNPGCRTPTTFVINAKPIVTFTTEPGASACINSDVTYTTQSGQTNYLWMIPGVLNTDYSITSGGSSADNTVTLKWLTTGSKTVTINYNNASGCTSSTATSSIVTTVNASFTSGAINSTGETICNGGIPATTIGSATAASGGDTTITYSWRSSADGYVAAISGATSATYLPPSGLTTTISYRRYAKDGTCNTTPTVSTGTWTVTVNSLPTTPTASATSQPTCIVSKGTITVTAPTGMNYSIDGTDYTNTTGTFDNLAAGSYTVTARNGSGCTSLATLPIAINAPITNTWNGTAWSKGTPPTSTDIVVFAANFTITSQLNACSVEINPGVKVVVGFPSGSPLYSADKNANAILHIENGLTVDDTNPTSSLTFENNASLIQVNDTPGLNLGKIIYKRESFAMKNFDYTYWSSPVEDQFLNVLSPNTLLDKYMSYSMNKWVVEMSGAGMMTPGKGYIIRVPKPQFWPNPMATTYIQPVQFVGIPNNGIYNLQIDPVGYSNLIGNPYPSAMSADDFLMENAVTNTRVEGTIRLWTHNSVIASQKYSITDYASYNMLGGIAAQSGGEIPLGSIAAGQSFFVKSAGVGPVLLNNSMRVGVSGENAQFFRGTKSKKTSVEKHRVWLSLSNTEGAFKQMLVGYATGATNGADNVYDGASSSSYKYVDFYSINNNANYIIQGRAVPFDKTDKVPLGYKSTLEGTFVISIDKVDGVLAMQPVFIEDKLNNVIHNLKDGPYSFTTVAGVFDDRFVLRYKDNTPVVTPPVVVEPPVVVVPPVVVEPPVIVVPPVVVDPPVVVVPPVVVDPPIVVTPPVVIDPPVVVTPPVVVDPPIVVTPPVVIDPPVVVDPPIVVTPPVVVDPPVVITPPVVVDPPPVVVDPPVVINPPIVVTPPVTGLDPTLENPSFDKKGKSVIVSVKDRQIKVNSFDETIAALMVYDLRGRLLYENDNVNKNEFIVQDLNSSDQFLIVVTQLINGKWVTKEIIFQN